MKAEAPSSWQVGHSRVAYLVQFGVFALLAMSVPALGVASGDIVVVTLGTFAGFPWSIPLWFVGGQTLSPLAGQALVVGCALLNVALLAALLRSAWVKTNRSAYTDSLNGTWKVCTLAGGALLLVALASLGILYTDSLAPAVLVGSAVASMLTISMVYLVPWRLVLFSLFAVGICVSGLWFMFVGLLVSMEHSAF